MRSLNKKKLVVLLLLVSVWMVGAHFLSRGLARNCYSDWALLVAAFSTFAAYFLFFHPRILIPLIGLDLSISLLHLEDVRNDILGGSMAKWYISIVTLLLTLNLCIILRAIIISPHMILDDEATFALAVASAAYILYQASRGNLSATIHKYINITFALTFLWIIAKSELLLGIGAMIRAHEHNVCMYRLISESSKLMQH